jgi:hypothetical protein
MRLKAKMTLGGFWCGLLPAAMLTFHADADVSITKGPYNGWQEAFTLSNATVEAVVVPAVGRVMQFRFAGEKEGPFWENHALDGKSPDSQSSEWINFGGDKTWPAPQSEWAKITGRGWPPPKAFDSMPIEAEVQGETLVVRSKIDPNYGIRTERRITLSGKEPEMKIETIYRKLEGAPIRVGIWVITQLGDPVKVFMPVPKNTLFQQGYNKQSEILPADLEFNAPWVTCTRSPRDSTKIGSDASDLIWGNNKWLLAIHAPREISGDFPDQGSSAEIYTNPDPNAYVELEMLGPLKMLKRGETMSRTQTYHLYRRGTETIEEQVRSLLLR